MIFGKGAINKNFYKGENLTGPDCLGEVVFPY